MRWRYRRVDGEGCGNLWIKLYDLVGFCKSGKNGNRADEGERAEYASGDVAVKSHERAKRRPTLDITTLRLIFVRS